MIKLSRVTSRSQLKRGSIVRNWGSGESYVVTANYGTRATAARTVDITNLAEWLMIDPEPS